MVSFFNLNNFQPVLQAKKPSASWFHVIKTQEDSITFLNQIFAIFMEKEAFT